MHAPGRRFFGKEEGIIFLKIKNLRWFAKKYSKQIKNQVKRLFSPPVSDVFRPSF
jgi:hypothetical protein